MERELSALGGIYIAKDRLKWFDELESQYQQLVGKLDKIKKKTSE